MPLDKKYTFFPLLFGCKKGMSFFQGKRYQLGIQAEKEK
jgi:hypothetical protein